MKKVAYFVAFCALVFSYGTSVSGELVTYTGREADTGDAIMNTVVINTDGARWLSAGFYCELSAGSLMQDPDYGIFPDPEDPTAGPAAPWAFYKVGTKPIQNPENDSFLYRPISYFANADQLADKFSGDPANAAASLTFIVPAVNDVILPFNAEASRFAFSPDAQGVWVWRNTLETAGNETFDYGYIVNGYMVPIPEPTTIALVLCGLVGLCVIRRK